MDAATRAQNLASDPHASTWLTANAGSGKTRVLTDRVARLLLAGCAPERILCLTYTKAAASEMQNRLLSRLGEWAMLPEPDLRARLAAIGAGEAPDLAEARRLFARAIETPGGLKVQTIHAFCAAILRRFPLEAGVPHGFTELDERSAALLRAGVLDEMAAAGALEIADLTAIHSGARLDGWLAGLAASDARMAPPDEAALCRLAGLVQGDTPERLLADLLGPAEVALIGQVAALAASGSANDVKLAAKLAAGNWAAPGLAEVAILESALLYGEKAAAPFGPKLGKVLTKATASRLPDAQALDDLAARVAEARPRRIGLAFVRQALALHRFGHAFASRYASAKAAQGWLDFDDLITRTEALLSAPDMAPWVLYRLDGGIDHVLVDEAQDTSPLQWQVIGHLIEEFMAGEGRAGHDPKRPRTLFVVGDPKQSIYSFQGADIAVFDDRRARFAAGFRAAGAPMRDAALRHSFRSSPAVLGLVDAVFQGPMAEGLGGAPGHIAFLADLPGRVDLWPVIAPPEKPESPPWDAPVDMVQPSDAPAQLAEAVAQAVAEMLGQPIRARDGGLRTIRAGDVLILVQRRSALFHQIIAALKRRGLPVAGADRLRLGGEVAVRDIRALLAFLSTPEDDLSLAEALRSPLIGLSEGDLYRLAAPRAEGTFLWEQVRAHASEGVRALLSDMLEMSAALRPYELISRILLRHGGRERLVARLGPEAEDGIDELMSQALAYERMEAPSLTGFLVWLEGGEVEVRRQPGSAGEGQGLIRVMTVHGAKGLESPVVIIPDGAKRRAPAPGAILRRADGPALPRGSKGQRPDAVEALTEARARAEEEERRRLLYVALTRAESWLVVAAAGEVGDDPADSWHAMVAAGMARAGGRREAIETPAGAGQRLSCGDWPDRLPEIAPVPGPGEEPPPEPGWLRATVPAPAPVPRPVVASDLGGAKVLAGTAPDPEAALFGTRLHLLLEHWPDLPGPDAAADLLAGAEGGLPDPATLAALWAEAEAVTGAEALAPLFAPGPGDVVLTEVALTAPLPGLGILHGTIDRLLVGPGRVLAIDYKSNAEVPARPEVVPPGILRQMAAYAAALALLYPGRRIDAAILWTRARSLMALPPALLDAAGLADPGPLTGPGGVNS